MREPSPSGPAVKIDDDFHRWLLDQAAALRDRRVSSLDWERLAEELEAMAAQDRRTIKKNLKKLLVHLLKFKAQPDELHRHHSWRKSVREAREDISDLLEESPGIFQGNLDEVLTTCYERARAEASDDTHLPLKAFPESCPWSFEQIMRDDFYPSLPHN